MIFLKMLVSNVDTVHTFFYIPSKHIIVVHIHEDVIVSVQFSWCALWTFQKQPFANMVARQDLGGSLPVQAFSRWFLPRLKCLRLRLWCEAEEMSVSVRQSGADTGGKAGKGNHLPASQQEGGLASRPVASTTRWARAATLCPSTSQKSAITCTFSRDTGWRRKNVRWELSDFLQDADLWPGTHSHWQGTHQTSGPGQDCARQNSAKAHLLRTFHLNALYCRAVNVQKIQTSRPLKRVNLKSLQKLLTWRNSSSGAAQMCVYCWKTGNNSSISKSKIFQHFKCLLLKNI